MFLLRGLVCNVRYMRYPTGWPQFYLKIFLNFSSMLFSSTSSSSSSASPLHFCKRIFIFLTHTSDFCKLRNCFWDEMVTEKGQLICCFFKKNRSTKSIKSIDWVSLTLLLLRLPQTAKNVHYGLHMGSKALVSHHWICGSSSSRSSPSMLAKASTTIVQSTSVSKQTVTLPLLSGHQP